MEILHNNNNIVFCVNDIILKTLGTGGSTSLASFPGPSNAIILFKSYNTDDGHCKVAGVFFVYQKDWLVEFNSKIQS